MKVYCVPGLGFDSRIFRNLKLDNIDIDFIEWIEPVSIKEKISEYASRMAAQIELAPERIILIGHSFGGVICQEIAKIIAIDKIILISSVKSRKEIPFNLRVLSFAGLYKLFTKKFALKTFPFWGSNQGYESVEEKALFVDMLSKHSDKYLKWALRQLSKWDNTGPSPTTSIIHIHGDRDKTFPLALIAKPYFIVKNGDHFMVYKQAGVIGEILNEEIWY